MAVLIPDETVKSAKMTDREMVLAIACFLFDSGSLALWPAAKLAGMERGQFEDELFRRKIPVYRPTEEDFIHDLAVLDRLGI